VETCVWIGFAAFFVASLSVGVRLLRLWARTRQLPELLIGLGVLGIGPVGFGLATVSELLRAQVPGLAQGLLALGYFAVGGGVVAKYVFNWRVYHPQSGGVRAAALTAGALVLLCYVADVAGGFDPYEIDAIFVLRSLLQVGCLLWGAAEALVYWQRMRRRLRIGLAEASVTNRFFLWGLGAGAAGVGSAIGVAAQVATGLSPLEIPWVLLSSSLHGLTAAVAMWLAFLPPAAYLRLLEARAARLAA
jgi:hypothetical protein